ncbi:hypothetical protein HYG79_00720 [Costertonia aggregata]|uniref:Uncharacterized protein n=2 Tax=Costertonia aggregata TaxID=343403 RepID=A0A7H9AUQ6_9FLAO|nr:hypothetical protein HYG79_00720 [Costertonia aggregata]
MCGFSSCARRVVTSVPANVTIVKNRPANYKIVRVKGKRYYFWNGKHYRKTRRGYVFVRV